MDHPLLGVAAVIHGIAPDGEFAGTCFSFRHSRYYVTAAHCVGDVAPDRVRLALLLHPTVDFVPVVRIHRHPSADIAVLEAELPADANVPFFWNSVSNYHYGEDVQAFGFPEDIFGAQGRSPTARMFRGHIQRTLSHSSHLGYTYEAAELNFGAPGGLSGGPVFRPDAPVMLIGLVTENLQSTTFLEAIEELETDGHRVKNHYQTVINYGLVLLLDQVEEWIKTIVPPRVRLAPSPEAK